MMNQLKKFSPHLKIGGVRVFLFVIRIFSSQFILAIEPIPNRSLSISHSAFSMNDDDISNETNQLFSLLPSLISNQRILVHNHPLITLKQIYSDKTIDYVKQWYERQSVPNLNLLIKRGLLKIYKEKSIRMTISNVSMNC
jgi:hypothetical protein